MLEAGADSLHKSFSPQVVISIIPTILGSGKFWMRLKTTREEENIPASSSPSSIYQVGDRKKVFFGAEQSGRTDDDCDSSL